MAIHRILLAATLALSVASCSKTETPKPELPSEPVVVADSFAYPIGKNDSVTQARDSDDWYNALDFGDENHLGEDWNKNSGGNTDCGEPVYATANGVITYAADAGPGGETS